MEALHPKLRKELKRVYPQLTDADIDRYEELTSLRFTFNPATAAGKIREIDAERNRLVRKMPRLGNSRTPSLPAPDKLAYAPGRRRALRLRRATNRPDRT